MSGKGSGYRYDGHVPSPPGQCVSVHHDSLELESLFECPVCSESVLPPIIQCAHGHLVCSDCLRMVAGKCPTCREPIGNIRNLAMEKLAKKILFPCKFKSSGCHHRLPADEKIVHQLSCWFRPMHCPYKYKACSWEGSADGLTAHLLEWHEHVEALEGSEVVSRAMCVSGLDTAQWTWIQLCFGHAFLLIVRKMLVAADTHYFCAVLQSIGSNAAADDFAYRLDYHSADGMYSFEGMPLGMHDSADIAMDNGDCLEFQVSSEQLRHQDGLLRIKSNVTHLV